MIFSLSVFSLNLYVDAFKSLNSGILLVYLWFMIIVSALFFVFDFHVLVIWSIVGSANDIFKFIIFVF